MPPPKPRVSVTRTRYLPDVGTVNSNTESVPDWVAFEGYLGATASTGALYDRHVLGQWDVLTGCW